MIKLNIISPELKNEIKFKIFYTSLRSIIFILIISILTHVALLITAKYILQAHANETSNKSILITNQAEDYDKKVANINEQVDYISKIQKDTVTWTKLIDTLSKSIDSKINISRISANQKSNSFNISGHVDTRQSLLSLKQSLEDTGLFTKISLPIDVLLQKENITFSINTNFKSYEFK